MLEDKKRGNSDHFDRIDLLECFIKTFGMERILVLLGDREFIGKLWIDWLENAKIDYVFRMKENGQYLSNSRGKMMKINELLRPLPKGKSIYLGVRKVGKHEKQPHHVSALRNEFGAIVVLIHSKTITNPLETYKKRWEIETMFKAFKSSGFDMEATHMTDHDRLNTLFSVMAIAFCIAYKTGIIANETEKIPIKSHGRKAQSILRKGLDTLQNLLVNIQIKRNEFNRLIRRILSCYGLWIQNTAGKIIES